jgi:hypothetical protein
VFAAWSASPPDVTASDLAVGIGRTCRSSCMRLQILLPSTGGTFDVGSRLETVATSTPGSSATWSDSPATSLHRPLAAAVHANSRIPLPNALCHAPSCPCLYRPYGIAITDDASPLHLPSTRIVEGDQCTRVYDQIRAACDV